MGAFYFLLYNFTIKKIWVRTPMVSYLFVKEFSMVPACHSILSGILNNKPSRVAEFFLKGPDTEYITFRPHILCLHILTSLLHSKISHRP